MTPLTLEQIARETAEKIRAIDSLEIYSESCTLPDLILSALQTATKQPEGADWAEAAHHSRDTAKVMGNDMGVCGTHEEWAHLRENLRAQTTASMKWRAECKRIQNEHRKTLERCEQLRLLNIDLEAQLKDAPRPDEQRVREAIRAGRHEFFRYTQTGVGPFSHENDYILAALRPLVANREDSERIGGHHLCEKGHGWVVNGQPCYLCQHARIEELTAKCNEQFLEIGRLKDAAMCPEQPHPEHESP